MKHCNGCDRDLDESNFTLDKDKIYTMQSFREFPVLGKSATMNDNYTGIIKSIGFRWNNGYETLVLKVFETDSEII